MQNMQTLVSGSTTFGQLYALLNNNMTTLASQFAGSTFPANPTTGQPCYRTDKNPPVWYIFNGTTWEDGAMASAIVTALLAETQKARGTAATLDARLDVALNADGTLKAPTPAGGWWTQETGTIARVSASSFSVAGDRRQIYTALRAVRLAQNTDADSHVVSCSYAAESDLTIVTIDDSVVDVGITTVFYGIDVASTPDFSSNADLAQVKAVTDLVTETPTANAVPQADAGGKLYNWVFPVGTKLDCYARDVPGFLRANGAAVSRTTYAALFSKIGTNFGVGDGSTTFNLPNANRHVFQGGTTFEEAWAEIPAGLPNITGRIGKTWANQWTLPTNDNYSGAFRNGKVKSTSMPDGTGKGAASIPIYDEFNASWSNPLFGASTTVQMLANTINIFIKY